MGNKVPREQSISEKIKQSYQTFTAMHKSGPISDSLVLMYKSSSSLLIFTLYKSQLSTAHFRLPLNDSFLIISRKQETYELFFVDTKTETLHILKFDSISSFLKITSQLFLSKRPFWSLTEMCQECCCRFSLATRCHHCRGCGKSICSHCSRYSRLDIYGYVSVQRTCQACVEKVKNFVEVITEFRKSKCQSFVHQNLYELPFNQSLIELEI